MFKESVGYGFSQGTVVKACLCSVMSWNSAERTARPGSDSDIRASALTPTPGLEDTEGVSSLGIFVDRVLRALYVVSQHSSFSTAPQGSRTIYAGTQGSKSKWSREQDGRCLTFFDTALKVT